MHFCISFDFQILNNIAYLFIYISLSLLVEVTVKGKVIIIIINLLLLLLIVDPCTGMVMDLQELKKAMDVSN